MGCSVKSPGVPLTPFLDNKPFFIEHSCNDLLCQFLGVITIIQGAAIPDETVSGFAIQVRLKREKLLETLWSAARSTWERGRCKFMEKKGWVYT